MLQKCSANEERLWYAQKAIEHGWSRNMMVHHIENRLYKREGKALSNFYQTLPLRDVTKPIGIAEYRLTESIPQNLKSNLPSIEDLEKELQDINPSE